MPSGVREPVGLRLERDIVKQASGCWQWVGPTNRAGYGRTTFGDSRKQYAHRFMFEQTHRPLVWGEVVMHKCDNSLCVNPEHLAVGTARDNVQDMIDKGRYGGRGRNMHCKRGHEYTPENTGHPKDGSRRCKECSRMSTRKRFVVVATPNKDKTKVDIRGERALSVELPVIKLPQPETVK